MGLFRKKKQEIKNCCCNGGTHSAPNENSQAVESVDTSIKVLGSGCTKCNQLEAATREALLELGINSAIEHITDFAQIAAYGVMTTPALVVGNKVVSYGKVLNKNEVINLLKANGL